ncbi:MAG: hypothetical protein IJ615_11300 [Bacteroidaceae bacterium]|nr:hypothetical protein [Bacteroidaceae bacterium]
MPNIPILRDADLIGAIGFLVQEGKTIDISLAIEPDVDAGIRWNGDGSIGTRRQMIQDIKEKIWAYIDEHPTLDLLGQPIKRDTHLIDFDTEVIEKDGAQWMVPKTFYVMPIKSEYEK